MSYRLLHTVHRTDRALGPNRASTGFAPALAGWWTRVGARFVALGEHATHHRMGSWTQR